MGFQGLKAITTKKAGAIGRNIAVKVTGYDYEKGRHDTKNRVIGIDLETGEEISIALRKDDKEASRKDKRAEVRDWSGNGAGGKRHKAWTEIGGVIVFESVFHYASEGLTARWGKAVSHDADQASVFLAYAYPYVSKNGKFAMEVPALGRSKLVTNQDELRQTLIAAWDNDPYAGAIVRAQDAESVYAQRVMQLKMSQDEKLVQLSPDEAVDQFLESDFGKQLFANIEESDKIEVIPFRRFFAGSKTQVFLKSPEHFRRQYRLDEETYGFTYSIITVRVQQDDGGKQLTAEPMPVLVNPMIYDVRDLPSPHITPQTEPKPVYRPEAAIAAGKAASGAPAQAAPAAPAQLAAAA